MDKNTAKQKVYDLLKQRAASGVTHWDFPQGFALRSRISDLRKGGQDILTRLESNNSNPGKHARYILIK